MADGHLKNSAGGHLVFGPAAGHLADECGVACTLLSTCGCCSTCANGGGDNRTNPRMKITLCWTDSAASKNFLGCSWENGESKIVCPNIYDAGGHTSNVKNEYWQAKYGTNTYVRLMAGGFTPPYYTRNSVNISASIDSVFNFYNRLTTSSGLSAYEGAFNVPTYSPTGIVTLGTPILSLQDYWFGHLTTTGGLSIKWQPLSGDGQSWDSFKGDLSGIEAYPCCNEDMLDFSCNVCLNTASGLPEECLCLARVNCGVSEGDLTAPRIKVTVCGGTTAYPRTILGDSWADGESKIVCPDTYTNYGAALEFENWSVAIAGDAISFQDITNFSTTTNLHVNFSVSSERMYIFREIFPNTTNFFSSNSGITSNIQASALAPLQNGGIKNTQLNGFLVLTDGTTIKWSPISGIGRPFKRWAEDTLAYTDTTQYDVCP